MTTTEEVPMHTAAWEIRYPSKEHGFEDVKYHGTNAVADYRDHVHPEAYARELVYRSDADARCAELEAVIHERNQSLRKWADWCKEAEAERDALAEKVKALQDDLREVNRCNRPDCPHAGNYDAIDAAGGDQC